MESYKSKGRRFYKKCHVFNVDAFVLDAYIEGVYGGQEKL